MGDETTEKPKYKVTKDHEGIPCIDLIGDTPMPESVKEVDHDERAAGKEDSESGLAGEQSGDEDSR